MKDLTKLLTWFVASLVVIFLPPIVVPFHPRPELATPVVLHLDPEMSHALKNAESAMTEFMGVMEQHTRALKKDMEDIEQEAQWLTTSRQKTEE